MKFSFYAQNAEIDPWMFLVEAYFVLLSTLYFQSPGSGHHCLGQRSLGGGWLLDIDSLSFVGSRKLSRDRSLRVFVAVFERECWQDCLFISALYRNKEVDTGSTVNAITVLRWSGLCDTFNSWTRSAYWPRMMLYNSVCTNLQATDIPIYHRFC